jgi:hypothetical protein
MVIGASPCYRAPRGIAMNALVVRAALEAALLLAAPARAAEESAAVEIVTPESVAAKRKAIVAENLPLTPEQAKVFWPLYEGYRAERAATLDERMALFGRFFDASRAVGPESAKALLDDAQKRDRQDLEMRSRWLAKMGAVLPATVVLRYAQIENKIDASIRYWMAEELPLVLDGKRLRVRLAGQE